MTVFGDTFKAVLGTLQTTHGESVTYTRKSVAPITLTAIRGNHREQVLNDSGTISQAKEIDWLINIADLGALVPTAGDTITSADGTWQIQPQNDATYYATAGVQYRIKVRKTA